VVGTVEHPVGVISERDVVAQLAQGADPDTVVRMTRSPWNFVAAS
jgi:CBS domain-containing protein